MHREKPLRKEEFDILQGQHLDMRTLDVSIQHAKIQNNPQSVRALLGNCEQTRLPQEGKSRPLHNTFGQHLAPFDTTEDWL